MSAKELFEAQVLTIKHEGELMELLDKCFPDWEDYTYDYYDYSAEVYGLIMKRVVLVGLF